MRRGSLPKTYSAEFTNTIEPTRLLRKKLEDKQLQKLTAGLIVIIAN
jgi:hypothetical protein